MNITESWSIWENWKKKSSHICIIDVMNSWFTEDEKKMSYIDIIAVMNEWVDWRKTEWERDVEVGEKMRREKDDK